MTVAGKRQVIMPVTRMLFGCLADGMYFEADVVSFNDGSGHGQARTPLGQVVGLNGDVDPLQSEVFRLTERALVKRDRRIAANPDVLGDVLGSEVTFVKKKAATGIIPIAALLAGEREISGGRS